MLLTRTWLLLKQSWQLTRTTLRHPSTRLLQLLRSTFWRLNYTKPNWRWRRPKTLRNVTKVNLNKSKLTWQRLRLRQVTLRPWTTTTLRRLLLKRLQLLWRLPRRTWKLLRMFVRLWTTPNISTTLLFKSKLILKRLRLTLRWLTKNCTLS